ncbi:MAG: Sb-PDE family phosphodiesterase, partial [Bacteroidales bacterium]|nr:Sb-PDE family phosphodiesterase [Bacteroidales bacterium]
DYNKYHRPMTLIFAKERSLSGLKEAMFDKQTVAWFANRLAGSEDLLKKLFEAALEVKKPFRITEEVAAFELVNHTDLMIHLKNTKPAAGAPKEVKVMPGSSVIMKCELLNGKAVLPYEVANFYTGTQSVLKVEINVIQ